MVVDSGATENVMPRSMFPEIGIRETERSKNGKGFKGPGRENIKSYGRFVHKSTWQVADVRRPLVSASHVIQAGNDLFIGKDEAYIMKRKSMLRKDGNVYVLDLFVRVPSSVAAPIVYTPMEVDANNQVADGGEPRRRVANLIATAQLFDGRSSERGRQVQANVSGIPESERWDADRTLEMRATPWSPGGSDTAFDIQVGMERPAEMVPQVPAEVLMENKVARTYLRRAHFEQWGLSEGCPGCRHLRTGPGRQQAHSEACRRRIEGLPKGDSAGSTRLAAADERINRVVAADAVDTRPRIQE